MRSSRVGRGAWLLNPENIKGLNNRPAPDVERYRDVIRRVRTRAANNKHGGWRTQEDIFLFGDDFDTILDLLEQGEDMEEHFKTSVENVSMICFLFD